MSDKKLRIIPLGGLGEVGKNMMVYEYGENILIVDTGLMFPENDMLGIDYIIPDFQYLLEKRDMVRGIVITHGHEDHTGAITHVSGTNQRPDLRHAADARSVGSKALAGRANSARPS